MEIEKFKNRLEEDYLVIDNDIPEILTSRTKILVKHITCGNSYYVNYHDYNNGRRCPHCYGTPKKTTEEVSKIISELGNGEYTLVSEYLGTLKPLYIKHEVCGKTFRTTFNRFTGSKKSNHGNRCPHCYGTPKKTTEEFKIEVEKLTNGEYTIVDTYINNKVSIWFYHSKCQHKFKMVPNHFLNGNRCTHCGNHSNGERRIREILEKNEIPYEVQKRFHDCKDKAALPFDFEIITKSGSKVLIEYQGIQHYLEPNSRPFATLELQKHDKMKLDYCKLNKLNLLVIPYTEYENLETILLKIYSTTIPLGIEVMPLGVGLQKK